MICFAAAKIGNSEVINEFLKHGFPVDVRNQDGYTPLMMATYYGHQDIVTTLLAKGQTAAPGTTVAIPP